MSETSSESETTSASATNEDELGEDGGSNGGGEPGEPGGNGGGNAGGNNSGGGNGGGNNNSGGNNSGGGSNNGGSAGDEVESTETETADADDEGAGSSTDASEAAPNKGDECTRLQANEGETTTAADGSTVRCYPGEGDNAPNWGQLTGNWRFEGIPRFLHPCHVGIPKMCRRGWVTLQPREKRHLCSTMSRNRPKHC